MQIPLRFANAPLASDIARLLLQERAEDAAAGFERRAVDEVAGEAIAIFFLRTEAKTGDERLRTSPEENAGIAGTIAGAHGREELRGQTIDTAGERADRIMDDRGRAASLRATQSFAQH